MATAVQLLLLVGAVLGLVAAAHGARGASAPTALTTLGVLTALAGPVLVEASLIGALPALVMVAAVSVGCLALASFARPHTERLPGLITPAVVVITCHLFTVNAISNPGLSLGTTFGRIAILVIWCGFLVLVSSGRIRLHHLLASLIVLFHVSVLLGATTPWGPCSEFKCGPFQQLYLGPFQSENFMARVASLALLGGLWMRRSPLGLVTVPTAALVVFATASRTSQLALVLALVAWGLWHWLGRPRTSVRGLTALGLTAVLTGLGAFLVHTAGSSDFSNRGGIWRIGLRSLSPETFVVGRGIDAWSVEVLARNFMHSQYLLLLFAGGLVAVVLHGVVVALLGAGALRSGGVGAAVLVFYLVSGLVETAWNPVALDGGSLLFLALAGTAMLGARSPSRVDDDTDSDGDGDGDGDGAARDAGRPTRWSAQRRSLEATSS